MKEHPKGLLAKNQHSRANQPSYALMTPCTNPSKFDSAHNIRNRIKFRRICVESSEQNGIRIFETTCPIMLLFGQNGLSDVVLSKYPNKSHNFQNYIFYDVVALEHYGAKMVVNKSGLYRLNLRLVRKLARHSPSRPSTHQNNTKAITKHAVVNSSLVVLRTVLRNARHDNQPTL